MIRYFHLAISISITLGVVTLITLAENRMTNSHRAASVRSTHAEQENSPPVIRIMQPAGNSVYRRNASVQYSIAVSDKEDGETRFDEIPSNRVFLQVEHVEGSHPISQDITPRADHPGFQTVRKSDCFNCHQFKSKSIGPSFSELARHYSAERSTLKMADNIRKGSQGRWGQEIMPAHPDISVSDAELIAEWIIAAGLRTVDDYLRGKEGTFRITAPVETIHGYFILTARYDDQGSPGRSDLSITGSSSLVIEYR